MPNTYKNKVVYNGTTLIDLTADTAIASDVASGKYFHLPTGERVVGTASGGGDVSLRELICPQQTVTPSSYEVSLEREEGFVIGGHYVVTYDGTEYLFTAGSLWGGNGICLGEQTYNYDHSARNDEIAPFLLWETFNDVTRTPKLYAKDNNSHAIKVERIDRDSIEVTNICPQQTVTTNSSYIGTLSNTTAQLVVGDYYLVTYDGTEWTLTAASLFNGETVSVGDDAVRYDHAADDNIYPFWIYNDGAGMKFYALDASASHTVRIDRITEIPDSIALTTKSITSNGTYRAMDDGANGYSSVTVNVAGADNTFVVTVSYNSQTAMWEPDCTYAELSAAATSGKNITVQGSGCVADGEWHTDNGGWLEYVTYMVQSNHILEGFWWFTSEGVEEDETLTAVFPTGNKSITQNGSNIDVAEYATVSVNVSGGGSMNVQTAQSTTRVASTTYTKTASLTCSVSGTYDVYWDCFRSTTSGTSGSQLYIGGTASGSANTTFSNHAQNNHRTGVTISANQEVAVYVRSRATNYYAYCGQLTIVQTA